MPSSCSQPPARTRASSPSPKTVLAAARGFTIGSPGRPHGNAQQAVRSRAWQDPDGLRARQGGGWTRAGGGGGGEVEVRRDTDPEQADAERDVREPRRRPRIVTQRL